MLIDLYVDSFIHCKNRSIIKGILLTSVISSDAMNAFFLENFKGDRGTLPQITLAEADHVIMKAPMGEQNMRPGGYISCLLYTSPSPRDRTRSRMPSSA